MKGRAVEYSLLEEVFLEVRADLPRAELHRQFVEMFDRPDVTIEQIKSLCSRRGWLTGRTGAFEKGQAPHNKGKAMPAETKAKLEGTWFRKGNVPHTVKHLGHERTNKDGYLEISVAKPSPSGFPRSYVLKHVWRWEQANGPLPKGHALKCLDGDKTNTDPSNWTPVPRALLPRLAGWKGRGNPVLAYDAAEPEVRPALLTIAKLEHAAREARKK